MKTALCRYTHAGTDYTVAIYFDSKAFELVQPPLAKEELDDFIRLIADSMATAMLKESSEKHFYIKRVLRYPQTLKLLCTDGFLIDNALIIPQYQQAYAKERVKITETEQLSSRLKLGQEELKNLNSRLSQFEEQARKDFPEDKFAAAKEPAARVEKATETRRELARDDTLDILAELGNVRKEMNEMAGSSLKQLQALSDQIQHISTHVLDEVMKETQNPLQYEGHQKQLHDFANAMIARSGGSHVEKNKEELRKKIDEITAIPNQFASELEETSRRITQQTNTLALFKQQVIDALYTAAVEYHAEFMKLLETASPQAKKLMVIEFNKKFQLIAQLSETGELSSIKQAEAQLGMLPLESLQKIISNEDKDYPGLLQKCNTSWTEESRELQIVIKHLVTLKPILSNLFKEDTQFSQYANQDMIQIIRVPFPRSYQFKFSMNALGYKKSVSDFCKSLKDDIIHRSKEYKRILQVNGLRDSTQRAMTDIQRQTESMKKPVTQFRDLLKRKETSGIIMTSVNKDHALAEQSLATAKKLLDAVDSKMDASMKIMLKKISTLGQDLQLHAQNALSIFQEMSHIKSHIDLTISNFSTKPNESFDLADIDAKIKTLEEKKVSLIDKNKILESLNNKAAMYDQMIQILDTMATTISKSDTRKQKNEAKALLLQFIKDGTRDPATTELLKKQMMDAYTQVDKNILAIDKAMDALAEAKKQLFVAMNDKVDPSASEFEKYAQDISATLQNLETMINTVYDHLSILKKLSLESTQEKK